MARHTCVICKRKREEKYMSSFYSLEISMHSIVSVKSWYCITQVSKWDITRPECPDKVIEKLSTHIDMLTGVKSSVQGGQNK